MYIRTNVLEWVQNDTPKVCYDWRL